MANYNVSKTGTKTSGASTLNDWSSADTWNISNLYSCMNIAIGAGDGNEIILNDAEGNMQRSANINTNFFSGGGTNTLIIRGRNNNPVILESTLPNTPIFTLNHATDAMTFDIRVPYKRQDGVVAIGNKNYHLINVSGAVNVIFNGGGCEGNTVVASESLGISSATVLASSSHTGSITMTNHYRKNISITQTRVSSTTAGGVQPGLTCTGSSNVTLDGVEASNITIANDEIDINGIDYFSGSCNLTIKGRNIYKDITGVTTGTLGADYNVRGSLNWVSSGITSMDADSNIYFKNINYSGRASGPFGFVATTNYTLGGGFIGIDCVTESEENSVGGLFLGISDNSTGTVNRLFTNNCRVPFGATYYMSNGASITVESAFSVNCGVLNGIFYKGGDGSMSAKSLACFGAYYNSQNPHQPADNQAGVPP